MPISKKAPGKKIWAEGGEKLDEIPDFKCVVTHHRYVEAGVP